MEPSQKNEAALLHAGLLAISVAALGHALQLGDGILQPGAIRWLAAALLVCAAAALFPMPRIDRRLAEIFSSVVIAICLAWQIWQLFDRPPFNTLDVSNSGYRHFRAGASIMCGLSLILLGSRPFVMRVLFPAVLLTYLLLGVWVIRTSASPIFDIFIFQRDSCDALMHGVNPYSITFPNIYGDAAPWYAPGLSVDGTLQFGYPYMPLTLLLTLPGHLLFGDFRYSHLAAMLGSAALIAYARPSRLSFAAASLLLLQPRGFYILERAWSDPIVLLLLCATVFAAIRSPRYLPLVLGLFLVSKQYALAAVALAPLLVSEWDTKKFLAFLGEAGLVALVATLPLAMLAPTGFWRSAVQLQFRQPYRWDSLSFVAWLGHGAHISPAPWWIAFIVLAAAIVLSLWRYRRAPAGFAAAVAFSYLCFFAFNKQAFANYYLVVIGAMCCAIGTAQAHTATEI